MVVTRAQNMPKTRLALIFFSLFFRSSSAYHLQEKNRLRASKISLIKNQKVQSLLFMVLARCL